MVLALPKGANSRSIFYVLFEMHRKYSGNESISTDDDNDCFNNNSNNNNNNERKLASPTTIITLIDYLFVN